jgi:hypothetical protein
MITKTRDFKRGSIAAQGPISKRMQVSRPALSAATPTAKRHQNLTARHSAVTLANGMAVSPGTSSLSRFAGVRPLCPAAGRSQAKILGPYFGPKGALAAPVLCFENASQEAPATGLVFDKLNIAENRISSLFSWPEVSAGHEGLTTKYSALPGSIPALGLRPVRMPAAKPRPRVIGWMM